MKQSTKNAITTAIIAGGAISIASDAQFHQIVADYMSDENAMREYPEIADHLLEQLRQKYRARLVVSIVFLVGTILFVMAASTMGNGFWAFLIAGLPTLGSFAWTIKERKMLTQYSANRYGIENSDYQNNSITKNNTISSSVGDPFYANNRITR